MSKLVYKSAGTNVIVLQLDQNCKTNENRINIIDPVHAQYRCDNALIVDIHDKYTQLPIDQVKSDYNKDFIYVRNTHVTVNDYNDDINVTCGEGIHYYLTYEQALYHGSYKIINGTHKIWHDDGALNRKYSQVNGNYDGLSEMWFSDGQIGQKYNYKNGKYDGQCESWFANGQLCENATYVNGEKNGRYEYYYENGQMREKSNYLHGKKHGQYESWYYANGKYNRMREKSNYVNGKKHGLCELWNENGQLREKCFYVNDVHPSSLFYDALSDSNDNA